MTNWGQGFRRCCLTLVLLELAGGLAQPAEKPSEARWPELLKLVNENASLTQRRVLGIVGPPRRKARQILYRRYMEQWLYETLVVEFDCPRNREPRLSSVHLLRRRNR
jgi:hypothetical protein